MKTARMFAAIVTALICGGAHAETPPQDLYVVGTDDVVTGYTAQYVKQGYNVGKQFRVVIPGAEQLTAKSSFSDKVRIVREGETYKSALIRNEHEEAVSKISQTGREVLPISGTAGSAEAGTVDAAGSFDVLKLHQCAKRTLPLLKKAKRAESLGETELLAAIQERLDTERSGVVCGKHLGITSTAQLSWRDEVKWLSAASAREGKELEQLARAFLASFDPAAPVGAVSLWRSIWSDLAISAVFTKGPLPSDDSIRARRERAAVVGRISHEGSGNTYTMLTSLDEAGVRRAFEAGRDFALRKIHGKGVL